MKVKRSIYHLSSIIDRVALRPIKRRVEDIDLIGVTIRHRETQDVPWIELRMIINRIRARIFGGKAQDIPWVELHAIKRETQIIDWIKEHIIGGKAQHIPWVEL